MTARMVTGRELGARLIDPLGLPKRVQEFNLHCDIDGIATIRCRYPPTVDIEAVVSIMSEYALVPLTGERKGCGMLARRMPDGTYEYSRAAR